MKKSLSILFFLFWSISSLLAQMPQQEFLTVKETKIASSQNSNKLFFLATESFPLDKKGRHFLKNEFSDGVIIDFENESFAIKLRYRVADDEMQMMHMNKIKAIYPSKIKQLTFNNADGNQVFVSTEYLEKKVKVTGYFELMSEGKIQLLKMYRVKKSNLKTCFFTQQEGKIAKPLKLSKSKVLNAFGERKSEAAKYAAKERLNLKKGKDLKKLFDYMNK